MTNLTRYTGPNGVQWFDCLRPSDAPPATDPVKKLSDDGREGVSVVVLERISSCTALVSWSDACHGCLGEQVWALVRAHNAICALSGERLKRGDAVYRSRRSKQVAINKDTVIAARHVLLSPMFSDLA